MNRYKRHYYKTELNAMNEADVLAMRADSDDADEAAKMINMHADKAEHALRGAILSAKENVEQCAKVLTDELYPSEYTVPDWSGIKQATLRLKVAKVDLEFYEDVLTVQFGSKDKEDE